MVQKEFIDQFVENTWSFNFQDWSKSNFSLQYQCRCCKHLSSSAKDHVAKWSIVVQLTPPLPPPHPLPRPLYCHFFITCSAYVLNRKIWSVIFSQADSKESNWFNLGQFRKRFSLINSTNRSTVKKRTGYWQSLKLNYSIMGCLLKERFYQGWHIQIFSILGDRGNCSTFPPNKVLSSAFSRDCCKQTYICSYISSKKRTTRSF